MEHHGPEVCTYKKVIRHEISNASFRVNLKNLVHINLLIILSIILSPNPLIFNLDSVTVPQNSAHRFEQ
jgi:hypothetical protein